MGQCLAMHWHLVGTQIAGMFGMSGIRIDIGLNINHAFATDPHLGRPICRASNETGFKSHGKR